MRLTEEQITVHRQLTSVDSHWEQRGRVDASYEEYHSLLTLLNRAQLKSSTVAITIRVDSEDADRDSLAAYDIKILTDHTWIIGGFAKGETRPTVSVFPRSSIESVKMLGGSFGDLSDSRNEVIFELGIARQSFQFDSTGREHRGGHMRSLLLEALGDLAAR